MHSIKKNVHEKKSSDLLIIDDKWIRSLKNVLITFFGTDVIDPFMFEHGRNISQEFFYTLHDTLQNRVISLQDCLPTFCKWLERNGFGTIMIRDYEYHKTCKCQITSFLKELGHSYYCGLLTGILECLWGKNVTVKYSKIISPHAFEVLLQDDY